MPEGPEIRRAADRIASILVGRPVERAELHLPGLERFEKPLQGSQVTAVDTRGKAMLTRFDNGLTLYSHNQLYGVWRTSRRGGRTPRTSRQLRVGLHTATHSALLYSASDIDVLNERQLAEHPFLATLGPDVLDRSLTPTGLQERLGDPRFAARQLASLYLDQRFLAGLGNYLRSEILFIAKIWPRKRAKDLTKTEIQTLTRETMRVSRRSYRTRGITVLASVEAPLKALGEAREARRFYVFGREGQACRVCETSVQKNTAAGRNLFYCPACQIG